MLFFKHYLWIAKWKTNWHVAGTVQQYRPLLCEIYGHLTPTIWILLAQNLLALSTSPTVHL